MMELTFDQRTLVHELRQAGVFATEGDYPVLRYLRFTLEDGELTITGSDLDRWCLRRPDYVEASGVGDVLIPSKKLAEVVRELPGQLRLEANGDGSAALASGDFRLKLYSRPGAEYPPEPVTGPYRLQVTLPWAELVAGIERVACCMSDDAVNPRQVGGFCFENLLAGDTGASLVALDGHRLATTQLPGAVVEELGPRSGPDTGPVTAIVHHGLVRLLPRMKHEGLATLRLAEEWCVLEVGHNRYLGRLLPVEVPHWRKVLAVGLQHTHHWTLDRQTLERALQAARKVAKTSVRLELEPGGLTLRARSEGEEFVRTVTSRGRGSDELLVSPRYLHDIVRACPGDFITLRSGGSKKALYLAPSPATETEDHYLLMPMKEG